MKIIQVDSPISVSNPAWITCTYTAVPKNLISTTMLAQEGHEKTEWKICFLTTSLKTKRTLAVKEKATTLARFSLSEPWVWLSCASPHTCIALNIGLSRNLLIHAVVNAYAHLYPFTSSVTVQATLLMWTSGNLDINSMIMSYSTKNRTSGYKKYGYFDHLLDSILSCNRTRLQRKGLTYN